MTPSVRHDIEEARIQVAAAAYARDDGRLEHANVHAILGLVRAQAAAAEALVIIAETLAEIHRELRRTR